MMISTKRCNNLATPSSMRLCGSLPIKKRTFQPFKKIGAPFDPKHLHVAPGGDVPTSHQTIVAVVSRDSVDASSRRESNIGSKSLTMGIKDHSADGSNSSSSEDRRLQDDYFSVQGKELQGKKCQQNVALHGQHSSRLATPPQDRRYTGDTDETRCSATTTRGRECAYIALGNSSYCYMHADYDTNPPPRRGMSKLNSKTRTRKRAETPAVAPQEDTAVVHPKRTLSAALSVSENSIETSGATPSLKGEISVTPPETVPVACRETYELNKIYAESSNTLLSTISTDQWFQQTVRVGTGPLKSRVGQVKKWGNGWVSVHIAGVGLHNRRSFELYLHSHDAADDVTEVNKPHLKPILQESGNPCLQQSLSVSRTWDESNNRCFDPIVVTPRSTMTSKTVVEPKAPRNSSLIRVQNSWKEPAEEFGACNIVSPPAPWRPLISDTPSILSLNCNVGMLDEGNTSKTFYGTPAPGRSRRSVHKPSRFQETEMLENIHGTRKRSRSRGDEEDTEKRPRYGLFI